MVDGREAIIVEHVTRLRDGDAPDFLRDRCQRLRTAARHDNARPLTCKQTSGGSANSGATAGDESNLRLKPHAELLTVSGYLLRIT